MIYNHRAIWCALHHNQPSGPSGWSFSARTGWCAALLVALFACRLSGATGTQEIPTFMVQRWIAPDNWEVHVYSPPLAGPFAINDALLTATVQSIGSGEWELRLTPKPGVDLRSVYFPFRPNRRPLDNTINDDLFFYPLIAGSVEHALSRNVDFSNQFVKAWPGGAFAPLVIMADSDQARLVFASNWPPIAVAPAYHAQRLELWYPDESGLSGALWPPGLTNSVPAAGDERTYRFIERLFTTGPETEDGVEPWHLALDSYREWLDAHVAPAETPEWMRSLHGIHAIGLQDLPLPPGEPNWIIENLQIWIDEWAWAFPWVQIWGQMSDYSGDCCYPEYGLHPRYLASIPTIVQVVENIIKQGMRAGYYASPDWTAPVPFALDTPAGVAFLEGWIERNTNQYGANSHYIDVIGRVIQGDPDRVRQLFDSSQGPPVIPPDTFIEGIVDIYPSAHLLSGATIGCCGFNALDPTATIDWPPGGGAAGNMMFPRMAPYLLPDRTIFLGGGNGEAAQWGAANDHVVERETFLIGAKIIAFIPDEPDGSPNSMVVEIVNTRNSANWWSRHPRFTDTIGLTDIPPGLRATSFRDHAGRRLVAIDNFSELTNQTITVDGQSKTVPSSRISILTLCPIDTNGDGAIDLSDLVNLLATWGPCATPCAADLDFDGMVGFTDLFMLLAGWGPCN